MLVARTPVLEIAYEERNAGAPETVVFLHGFPDDGRTWDAVLARPAFAGVRAIVPWLRGYGATRFRDPHGPRRAQVAALARDVVDLLDALAIGRATLVGHDWGARAAYGAAVLAPERIARVLALSVGYATNFPGQTMSYAQAEAYWYQWLLATPRGEAAIRDDREAFCRNLWHRWSPSWRFTDDEFAATARAFANPDFPDVVLHSYRQRWGFADGDPAYANDAAALAALPPLAVPVTVLHGDEDGATLPEASVGMERYVPHGFARRVLHGVGHFVQREAPDAVAAAFSER